MTYWDKSALILALHDETVRDRLLNGEHVTRTHSLSEMFSVLTGGRFRVKYSPNNAALLAADIAQQVTFVDLSTEETLRGLKEASRHQVFGGRIHDWMHALAAEKAGAKMLLTLNGDDFLGLERGFTVAAP
jgi:predicted nucleic acid-binding protein